MSVSLSNDNKFVISGSKDKTIKLWYVYTGECLKTFSEHSDVVNSVSFSFDNKYFISGSNDGTIKMWKVSTGECIRTF